MKNGLATILLMFSLMPILCFAWGRDGHSIVGTIADANLTPQARAKVRQLLRNDLNNREQPSGRRTLAAVASWADEIRGTTDGEGTDAWHYRNNPVCKLDEDGPCENGCIDVAINDMVDTLKNRNAPARERNEALKWIVHLVGDIHQPLHSGDNKDRGGNNVKVALAGMQTRGAKKLHGVWDSAFVTKAKATGPITARLPGDFTLGDPTQWMAESRKLSMDYGYSSLEGFACGAASPSGIVVLNTAYQDNAARIVRQQLVVAGLRLAKLLNEALAP